MEEPCQLWRLNRSDGHTDYCARDVSQPEPTQCDCQPTGQSACELRTATCSNASDCPTDFTCEEELSKSVCRSASATKGSGTTAGSAAADALDAGTAPDCLDAGRDKVCLPPYYAFAHRGALGGASDIEQKGDAGVTGAGGSSSSSRPSSDASTSVPRKKSHGCSLAAGTSDDAWLGLLGSLLLCDAGAETDAECPA